MKIKIGNKIFDTLDPPPTLTIEERYVNAVRRAVDDYDWFELSRAKALDLATKVIEQVWA